MVPSNDIRSNPTPMPPIERDSIYLFLSTFDCLRIMGGLTIFESLILIPEILFAPVKLYLVMPKETFLFSFWLK